MRTDEIFGLLQVFSSKTPGFLLFELELAFWLLACLLAWVFVWLRPVWLIRLEDSLCKISEHKRACVLGIFLSVIVVRLSLLVIVPVPVPYLQDEFSYLLGADTFAQHRLANPVHPMAVHFETFHVNMWPTYQSMYPPLQGLILAVGQVLTGMPWIGVVCSVAILCAVICWMLQGWLPPQWALLGGVFAVLRYGIFSYWINSYFGGAVAAIGGALVMGAYARFRRNQTLKYSLLLVTGLVVLANSRPFEGMMFALPIVIAALVQLFRSQVPQKVLVFRTLVPSVMLFAAALSWMGYYNWRGTGSVLQMPYATNFAKYHITKPFFGQARLPVPNYTHQSMRSVYVFWELPDYLNSRYAEGIEDIISQKAISYYAFFIWPCLLIFACGVFVAFRDSHVRIVALSLCLLSSGLFMELWKPMAHYAAPATGAVIFIFVNYLRTIRTTSRSEWELCLSRAIVVAVGAWMTIPIISTIVNPLNLPEYADVKLTPAAIDRDRIETVLQAMPGKHLVIVHYPWKGNWATVDWIYNRADIDRSRIVWARDMGFVDNRELLDYYGDRHIWYVSRQANLPMLIPYDQALPNWKVAAKYIPETTKWTREQSSSELAQRGSQPHTNF